MKNKLLSITLAGTFLLLTGCTNNIEPADTETTTQTITEAITEEASEIISERIYPDNIFKDVPEDYIGNESVPKGSIVRFTYDTSDPLDLNDDKKMYQKSALVYLPACYDENDAETKYNVFYLMHGGSDSPEWFFEGGKAVQLKLHRLLTV